MTAFKLYHPDPDKPGKLHLSKESGDNLDERTLLSSFLTRQLNALIEFKTILKPKTNISHMTTFSLDSELINDIYKGVLEMDEDREDMLIDNIKYLKTNTILDENLKLLDSKHNELIDITFYSTKDNYNPGKIYRAIGKLISAYKININILEEDLK